MHLMQNIITLISFFSSALKKYLYHLTYRHLFIIKLQSSVDFIMTDEHKLAQKCELEGKYDLVLRFSIYWQIKHKKCHAYIFSPIYSNISKWNLVQMTCKSPGAGNVTSYIILSTPSWRWQHHTVRMRLVRVYWTMCAVKYRTVLVEKLLQNISDWRRSSPSSRATTLNMHPEIHSLVKVQT